REEPGHRSRLACKARRRLFGGDRGHHTPGWLARLIRLDNVTKTFPGPRTRTVLAQVSLDVPRGQLVAILGESGVGKSTLLNLIAGLEQPDTGAVVVADVALAGMTDDALTVFRRAH